ncbi:MAG: nucleotidyltransferase [Candidatus Scalindua rubra]|uniref:Nucleotidyltransferase n=1 Tax=Candidatus Scalindua rubra TaxID=1872076 RepID=A0A1E3XFH9_9BACT|nr:MAG: nucleotidyltransferase [Candidatus Scalindua rubra]
MKTKGIESIAERLERLKLTKSEKDALSNLITDIKSSWPDAKLKIFGSKVKGVSDEESDLDILIVLPCDVTEETRRQIIHKVFEINLAFESNISPLIMAEKEWESPRFSLLPIHTFIEEEGVPL